MIDLRNLWALVLSLGLLSACSPPADHPSVAALDWQECRIRFIDTAARCLMLDVPEDHADPSGRKIRIHVALIPALARNKEPDPVVFLAGGPGQAASDMGRLVTVLGSLRRSRDILLVDQRGTGLSKTLRCATYDRLTRDDWFDPKRLEEVAKLKDWTQCLAELQGNPRTHRTDDYIADLERVRQALGVPAFNLWGGSYGSRVALRYMKLYPQSIRTAVLDGLAPTSLLIPNDLLRHSERLLEQSFAACAASSSCAKAYPDLATRFSRLLQRLAAQPMQAQLIHPGTGQSFSTRIDDRTLLSLLWPLLYTPESQRLIPQLIAQAEAGRFDAFLALSVDGPLDPSAISVLQRFAVLCAEDMTQTSQAKAPANFRSLAQLFREGCEGFPAGRVAPEYFTPTRSDIPTLLLSGSLDPVTPPSTAEEVGQTLTRHRHLVVEGMGHIVSPHPCLRRVITRFIEDGRHPDKPLACEAELKLPPPHFYVDARVAQP